MGWCVGVYVVVGYDVVWVVVFGEGYVGLVCVEVVRVWFGDVDDVVNV